jgi:hypothetical protein
VLEPAAWTSPLWNPVVCRAWSVCGAALGQGPFAAECLAKQQPPLSVCRGTVPCRCCLAAPPTEQAPRRRAGATVRVQCVRSRLAMYKLCDRCHPLYSWQCNKENVPQPAGFHASPSSCAVSAYCVDVFMPTREGALSKQPSPTRPCSRVSTALDEHASTYGVSCEYSCVRCACGCDNAACTIVNSSEQPTYDAPRPSPTASTVL